MAIPNITFSTGMYFGDINGYSASSFEPAYQGSNAYYRRAMTRPSCIYFVTASGTKTDMYTLAFCPISASVTNGTDSVTRQNSSYFKEVKFCSSDGSLNFNKKFLIKGPSLGSYPLSLAFKGYRVMTSPDATKYSISGKSYYDALKYSFFNRNIIAREVTTDSELRVTLTRDGYSINGGTERPWTLADGSSTKRYCVGVALQAGGAAGGDGWCNHNGGGGSAGAFWAGFLTLGENKTEIVVEGYIATQDGKEGSDITIRREHSSGVDYISYVYGGQYSFGGNTTGTSEGGYLAGFLFSGSEENTIKKSEGGDGVGAGKEGKGLSTSKYTAPVPDMGSISFDSMKGGEDVWLGGGGGASVMGKGGKGGDRQGDYGQDRGVDCDVPAYGAGGGGGGGYDAGDITSWGGKRARGGSGGYPYIVIGY